ncbi:alpha/beta fold hydrolase [Actibacterium sp. XHP0104]|uniref:alpha/beta fold hydrolase n=1 Tax=Actibacterium sp. XHP0104 TaxID=2984335 RepID=UPI0021E6F277|nr:alpha/beta hydrolase [Actibacterium sp. XHP0104]MCV2882210.1 alpha/beta fold hydrolase [Actibacterium sp. XHP0104]
MAKIILIHGAWGCADTWSDVAPLLRAAGHEVTALTLPGHKGDTTAPDTVGLADYARAISDAVGDGPAVLVGHSMGGMAISAAAELIPDRVTRLIYVAAFLPQDGDSLLSLIKRQALTIGNAVRKGPVAGTTVLDPDTAAGYLFQDATPDQRARGLSQLGVQPNAAQTDPASLSAGRFGAIPKGYVLCDGDQTILPPLQQAMATGTAGVDLRHLDAGHFPQLTAADDLAAMLLDMIGAE